MVAVAAPWCWGQIFALWSSHLSNGNTQKSQGTNDQGLKGGCSTVLPQMSANSNTASCTVCDNELSWSKSHYLVKKWGFFQLAFWCFWGILSWRKMSFVSKNMSASLFQMTALFNFYCGGKSFCFWTLFYFWMVVPCIWFKLRVNYQLDANICLF